MSNDQSVLRRRVPVCVMRTLICILDALRRRLQPVMRACRRCGEAVPQLWVQALGFLATLTAQLALATRVSGSHQFSRVFHEVIIFTMLVT